MTQFVYGSAVLALVVCPLALVLLAFYGIWVWLIGTPLPRKRDRVAVVIILAAVWTVVALAIGSAR